MKYTARVVEQRNGTNYQVRRLNWKWPNWKGALGERSYEWFRENLSETQFFARWSSELKRIGADESLQRQLIYEVNHSHNLRMQRRAYDNNADARRQDARDHRRIVHGDNVLLERKRESARLKIHRRCERDTNYVIQKRMRTRIYMALRGYKKAGRTVALLGCSLDEARQYIQDLWQPGMNWENWSRDGWHIDHKIPCSKFNLRDPEEQKKCFNYTNLQPLWCDDNWRKGDQLL